MSIMDPAIAEQRYEHGTIGRYKLGLCRCFKCKVALSTYVYELSEEKRPLWRVHYIAPLKSWCVRNRKTAELRLRTLDRELALRTAADLNKISPVVCDRAFVSTAKAVKHIRKLQAAGVGYKVIARRAAIGKTAVFEIMTGASKHARRETVDAILSVDASVRAPGQKISATQTWALIDALVAFGFSKAEIGRRMGVTGGKGGGKTSSRFQMSREVTTVRNAARVKAVYDAVFTENAKFRAFVDPAGEARRAKRAEHEFAELAKSTPLSKREPKFKARLDRVFADLGSAL